MRNNFSFIPENKLTHVFCIAALSTLMMTASTWAGDVPEPPETTTVPGTGGFVWGAPAPDPGRPEKPPKGGLLGLQYPPDVGTKVKCTHNGKEVACP